MKRPLKTPVLTHRFGGIKEKSQSHTIRRESNRPDLGEMCFQGGNLLPEATSHNFTSPESDRPRFLSTASLPEASVSFIHPLTGHTFREPGCCSGGDRRTRSHGGGSGG